MPQEYTVTNVKHSGLDPVYGPRFRYDPEAPTNREMADYCREARERQRVAEYVQTFVDNFENFLQELEKWAQQ